MTTQQTVYYDAQGNAYVPADGPARAPKAGDWYISTTIPRRAVRALTDFKATNWRGILRPARPHEDPCQVPACMTREGEQPWEPRTAEQAVSAWEDRDKPRCANRPNEAFFAALREYVQMEIAAREGRADMRSAVALLDALAERFDAAVDARVERALAHLEAQRQAERVTGEG